MEIKDREVIQKISECITELGGESDIVGTVSSWKDTLDNKEVLADLKNWLQATKEEKLHPA